MAFAEAHHDEFDPLFRAASTLCQEQKPCVEITLAGFCGITIADGTLVYELFESLPRVRAERPELLEGAEARQNALGEKYSALADIGYAHRTNNSLRLAALMPGHQSTLSTQNLPSSNYDRDSARLDKVISEDPDVASIVGEINARQSESTIEDHLQTAIQTNNREIETTAAQVSQLRNQINGNDKGEWVPVVGLPVAAALGAAAVCFFARKISHRIHRAAAARTVNDYDLTTAAAEALISETEAVLQQNARGADS